MYTKEQIVSEIKRVAAKLGKTDLKAEEFEMNSTIPMNTLNYYLGSWKQALKEADLGAVAPERGLETDDEDELLLDLVRLYEIYGEIPTLALIKKEGKYKENLYQVKWNSLNEAFKVARRKFIDQPVMPFERMEPAKEKAPEVKEHGEDVDVEMNIDGLLDDNKTREKILAKDETDPDKTREKKFRDKLEPEKINEKKIDLDNILGKIPRPKGQETERPAQTGLTKPSSGIEVAKSRADVDRETLKTVIEDHVELPLQKDEPEKPGKPKMNVDRAKSKINPGAAHKKNGAVLDFESMIDEIEKEEEEKAKRFPPQPLHPLPGKKAKPAEVDEEDVPTKALAKKEEEEVEADVEGITRIQKIPPDALRPRNKPPEPAPAPPPAAKPAPAPAAAPVREVREVREVHEPARKTEENELKKSKPESVGVENKDKGDVDFNDIGLDEVSIKTGDEGDKGGITYIPQTIAPKKFKKKRKMVGEPLDFRGLRFAPLDEEGVIFLFGMINQELGFVIDSVQSEFPAAEGKRCFDKEAKSWEHVRIDFEFKSSQFKEKGHDDEQCDLIVCWVHDWQDPPLEVLELSSTIKFLPGYKKS